MRQHFVFNDIISSDYGVYISGSGTYDGAERDVEAISIPGRNGDLTIDNGKYNNIELTYPAFIYDSFDSNAAAFRNLLSGIRGYKKLTDTYHPDEYRLARYKGGLKFEMTEDLYAGQFNIEFDCYPQRFLKSGDIPVEFSSNGAITNRWSQTALPLVRVYGNGTVTIGSISIVTANNSTYLDIDCDLQEAYKDTLATNMNDKITLTNGKFFELPPGESTITLSGVTKIIITPRWWIL